MRLRDIFLLALIPLSEIKALFYNSDKKVSWYIFTDEKKFLCNVLEDYSNAIIFAVIFFYFTFLKLDFKTKRISLFLFCLSTLDIFHLALNGMHDFLMIKFTLAVGLCSFLKTYIQD